MAIAFLPVLLQEHPCESTAQFLEGFGARKVPGQQLDRLAREDRHEGRDHPPEVLHGEQAQVVADVTVGRATGDGEEHLADLDGGEVVPLDGLVAIDHAAQRYRHVSAVHVVAPARVKPGHGDDPGVGDLTSANGRAVGLGYRRGILAASGHLDHRGSRASEAS